MSRFVPLTLILMALTLAAVPAATAGKRPKHCRSDNQCSRLAPTCCGDGQCCTGSCNGAGHCCLALAEQACGDTCCDVLGGQTCCGDGCVDTQSDGANCGSCGNVCTGGKTCQGGTCACPSGQTECYGECVDTQIDTGNCGACGNGCSGFAKDCQNGSCVCPPGLTDCGNCIDTTNDPSNCGSCGNTCARGQVCENGACHCSGFNDGCAHAEICQNGTCVNVCGVPGPAADGDFTACPDGHGGYVCGCNGCVQCAAGLGCCHCGCMYSVTTCDEFCQD